jgi:hypothetical protein
MTKRISHFRGPSLMLVAIAHIVVFLAGLAAAVTLPHGASYVTPFAPAEQVRLFFSQNPTAVRISNFFLFGSAVPFGIFVATAISRLRFYGVRAAGTNIALFGGMSAAFALFLSGMSGWILSTSGIADSASLAQALYYLSFLAGGAFSSVAFGILAAGISITSYFNRLLPQWLFVLGMLVAITGELSSLSLVTFPANFLIPFTRYIGFLWMILVASALRRDRRLAHNIPDTNAPRVAAS